jgi:Fe-S-cluster containining protein
MNESKQMIRFYTRGELLDSRHGWKDIMPPIHAQIDAQVHSVEGLACRAGCAHCCKLQVDALPHEVVDVVDYVRFGDHFTREERARILEKLRLAVALTLGMNADQYRALNLRCPFLADNDTCSVYPVRPVSCRAFGSTDVEVCALTKPDDQKSAFRAVPASLQRLLATSGQFFTPFLQSCLDWWQGDGVTSRHTKEELEAMAMLRDMLDRGMVK